MSGGKEQSSVSECCLTAVGEGGRHDTYSQTAELVPWDVTTKDRNWEVSD